MLFNPLYVHRNYTFEGMDQLPGVAINEVENLVFSGGGIKGLAYASVAKYLEEKGQLEKIKRFAGSSAGAIMAALLAVGVEVSTIETELGKQGLFAGFLQGRKVNVSQLREAIQRILQPGIDWRLAEDTDCIITAIKQEYTHYGVCEGDKFTEWFGKILKDNSKFKDKDITFIDFYNKTDRQKELHITMCDYTRGVTVVANHNTTPTMKIIDAVRASMAIPFVFTPLNGKYVDGGTMYNYPIELFDGDSAPEKTLGFILSKAVDVLDPEPSTPENFFGFASNIFFKCIFNVGNEYCFRLGNQYRTVFIDTAGIDGLDFDLNEKQKKALLKNGGDAIEHYFAPKYGPNKDCRLDYKEAYTVIAPNGFKSMIPDIKSGDNSIIVYGNIYDASFDAYSPSENEYDFTRPNGIYAVTGWTKYNGNCIQRKGKVTYLPNKTIKVSFSEEEKFEITIELA